MYLGGNRVAALALTKKLNLKKADLPDKYLKKIKFDVENDTDSVMDAVNEVFGWIEQEHYDLNSIKKACHNMMKILPLKDEKREVYLTEIDHLEMIEQFKNKVLESAREALVGSNRESSAFSPAITQIIEYMKKNYHSDISLEKCAELTGNSYSYISREFKRETGMRFVEYLNQLRITKAKSLLLGHQISMKEVVEQTGFRNYNYFFKVFKEAEGITPSEFAAKN